MRYSQSAPAGLSGACVEVPQGSTGENSNPSTSSGSLSSTTDGSSSGSTTTSMSTTDADSSSSSSSGAVDSDTSASTNGSSSTSSSLCPDFVEEFDNGELVEAPWTWVAAEPPLMSEGGDALRYSISSGDPRFGELALVGADLANGYVVAHLTALPQDPAAQFRLRVQEGDGERNVEFILSGPDVLSVEADGASIVDLTIAPTPMEVWLEIFVDAGDVNFAYSVDGDEFLALSSAPTAFGYDNATVSLIGGFLQPIDGPAHVIEVDDFEMCVSLFE